MKKVISLGIFIFTAFLSFSQNGDPRLKAWPADKVEEARQAATASYLSKTEIEVIFLLNLVRTDGQLFFETFVEPYEEKNEEAKDDTYIRSLKKDLKSVNDYSLLVAKKDLSEAAKYHAETSGKRGQTGHPNYRERMKDLQKKYKSLGENNDYGRTEAIDIVMSLLIDRGIADLGHRINILNPKYNSIGVGTAPHKRFRTNFVMEFGEL